MKMSATLGALMLSALALATPARADLITYSGSFDVSFPTGSPVSSLKGSFSFQFDASLVPSTGAKAYELGLKSLTLTPSTIGSTAFTTANVGVYLEYKDGAFKGATVGGTLNGPTVVNSFTDDFSVLFGGPDLGSAVLANAVVATRDTAIRFRSSGSGSITAVPEPSSLAIVGIAGAILTAAARRRRAG